jgi:hypothetical protein
MSVKQLPKNTGACQVSIGSLLVSQSVIAEAPFSKNIRGTVKALVGCHMGDNRWAVSVALALLDFGPKVTMNAISLDYMSSLKASKTSHNCITISPNVDRGLMPKGYLEGMPDSKNLCSHCTLQQTWENSNVNNMAISEVSETMY